MPVSRRGVLKAFSAAMVVPSAARAERRMARNEFFVVEQVELTVKGLDPAHDGLRIAQLSDIHVGQGTPDGRVIAAVRALKEEKPDLAVMTGDYVTTHRDPIHRVPELLAGIGVPTFAVMGNHDHWTNAPALRKGLEGVDYTVLQNQNTTFRINGADFTVIGIDDRTTRMHDAHQALKGAKKGSRLVLAHTPTSVKDLPENEGLLQLSGHTHGGQMHIPKLTAAVFRSSGQPYIRGLYEVNGNQVYVNRGLGFGKGTRLPRIASDPELTVVTLRRAA